MTMSARASRASPASSAADRVVSVSTVTRTDRSGSSSGHTWSTRASRKRDPSPWLPVGLSSQAMTRLCISSSRCRPRMLIRSSGPEIQRPARMIASASVLRAWKRSASGVGGRTKASHSALTSSSRGWRRWAVASVNLRQSLSLLRSRIRPRRAFERMASLALPRRRRPGGRGRAAIAEPFAPHGERICRSHTDDDRAVPKPSRGPGQWFSLGEPRSPHLWSARPRRERLVSRLDTSHDERR